MNDILYQKIGVIVEKIASELLTKEVGEKLLSVTEYEQKLEVSRGTIQNAISYLKEVKAISLRSRGHLGTFIESIDYKILLKLCMNSGLLGIMPLPYSLSYAGLATAFYELLSELNFNMAYIRGAENRIDLVVQGVYKFAICSEYAALDAVNNHIPIEIIMDLGDNSYLSKHVIVLKDHNKYEIEDGMRVAFDENSLDQREMTNALIQGKNNIKLVNIRAHQTIAAILSNQIDAGVWNYDAIVEGGYTNLNIVPLHIEAKSFSKAVIIIRKNEPELDKLLRKFIDKKLVAKIQDGVKAGTITSNF